MTIEHHQLRQQVCDYMAQYPDWFAGFADGPFRGFDAYLNYMRRDNAWGDHLTLVAVAHLLLRPVHVVSDHVRDENHFTVIPPPGFLAPACFGEPVVLAHWGEKHDEKTALLPGHASPAEAASLVDPVGEAAGWCESVPHVVGDADFVCVLGARQGLVMLAWHRRRRRDD